MILDFIFLLADKGAHAVRVNSEHLIVQNEVDTLASSNKGLVHVWEGRSIRSSFIVVLDRDHLNWAARETNRRIINSL
jgi:hypothetical protein